VEALGRALHNRLEEPALELSLAVATWRRRLSAMGTAGVLMSGSGTCLFALCRNTPEARQVYDNLASGLASEGDLGTRAFLVRSRP